MSSASVRKFGREPAKKQSSERMSAALAQRIAGRANGRMLKLGGWEME
jgi:hypothetical protein